MMHPKTITPLKCATIHREVEKTGDYTVVCTLKRPILNALAKFSFKIIPSTALEPQYLTRETGSPQPDRTGPYMLRP